MLKVNFSKPGDVISLIQSLLFCFGIICLFASFIFFSTSHPGVGNKLIFWAFRFFYLGAALYVINIIIDRWK